MQMVSTVHEVELLGWDYERNQKKTLNQSQAYSSLKITKHTDSVSRTSNNLGCQAVEITMYG